MLKKQKSVIKAVALSVALVFGVSFGLYHISRLRSDPVKTQTVFLQTVYKTIDAEMFVVRDESYLTSAATGVYVPLVKNGERVAGGDTVASMMRNEDSASLFAKKNQLEDDIEYYKKLSKISVTLTTDIDRIDKEIIKKVDAYVDVIRSGSLGELKVVGNEVRDGITHRQIVTGTTFNFSALIGSLEQEYQQVLNVARDGTAIIADKAGYFIAEVDGYETTLSYQNVLALTVEEIAAALQASPLSAPLNVKGKLVGAFDWYLVCALDTTDTETLSEGRTVTLHFPTSTSKDIRATVLRVNPASGGKTPVVLKADVMNESLSSLRKETVQIRTDEHSGYRVDNRAIRMLEGEKGVYIRRGNVISFRKIEVLYATQEFSIVDKDKSELKLYDEVVVEGADLYDGKVLG